MTLPWYAARANVSYLQHQHPDWTHAQLATVLGYSKGWVKKWLKRLREDQAAGVALEQTCQGHSRARKHQPSKTHPLVVEQILTIRDQPPEGLRRVPGQQAIRDYLQRDPALAFFQLPIPSCKTIYRVLKRHQRIPERSKPQHQPLERPKPMSVWQLDFKDVSSVPADPYGKQRHVVETLNIIDTGTSILLDAHVRTDFTAETALEALASTLAKYGCPQRITLDRDPRWVGSPAGSDFPSALRALAPAWASRSTSATRITHSKMALSNATIVPISKNAWPWTALQIWSRPEPSPLPSYGMTIWNDPIKVSPVAINPR